MIKIKQIEHYLNGIYCKGKVMLIEVPVNSKCGSHWIEINNKYYLPIVISETEKKIIEYKCFNKEYGVLDVVNLLYDDLKVLSLPENIYPSFLNDIIEGKIKDGDIVMVECEIVNELYQDYPDETYHKDVRFYNKIKLTDNYVNIFPVKKETNFYTEEDMFLAFKAGNDYTQMPCDNYSEHRDDFNKWLKELQSNNK